MDEKQVFLTGELAGKMDSRIATRISEDLFLGETAKSYTEKTAVLGAAY